MIKARDARQVQQHERELEQTPCPVLRYIERVHGRAGDQDAFEADAGLPTALQHFPHELARAERQRHVEDEKQGPDSA